MKAKWYIGTFIFIFTLLGVVNHNQVPKPNQEIVLQFTHSNVSANEAKNAIAIVKQQLQSIGVHAILVEEQGTGGLKISYYSESDIVSVKKALSETDVVALENSVSFFDTNPSELPLNKEESTYNLDVFEITKKETGTGFGGSCAVELKPEYNRFYAPVVSVSISNSIEKDIELLEKESYKYQRYTAVVINNTLHKIPEVRAGPNG